jgi:hypothetical protein
VPVQDAQTAQSLLKLEDLARDATSYGLAELHTLTLHLSIQHVITLISMFPNVITSRIGFCLYRQWHNRRACRIVSVETGYVDTDTCAPLMNHLWWMRTLLACFSALLLRLCCVPCTPGTGTETIPQQNLVIHIIVWIDTRETVLS